MTSDFRLEVEVAFYWICACVYENYPTTELLWYL